MHVERAGATLAEIPVFDEGTCPSNTAAEEDLILLFIEKNDVLALCLERPCISLAALKILAGRVRNCAALVEALSLRDVDRRFTARELITLLEHLYRRHIQFEDEVLMRLASRS